MSTRLQQHWQQQQQQRLKLQQLCGDALQCCRTNKQLTTNEQPVLCDSATSKKLCRSDTLSACPVYEYVACNKLINAQSQHQTNNKRNVKAKESKRQHSMAAVWQLQVATTTATTKTLFVGSVDANDAEMAAHLMYRFLDYPHRN